MPTRRVVLDISPSRLEFTLLAGRSVRATHIHPLTSDLLEDWPTSLDAVGPVLSSWVERHRLRGLPATVLYTSPDAHAGVIAVPAALPRQGAIDAGRLALADAVSFSLDLSPWAIEPLGPGSSEGQQRLLGIADTDASVNAVYTLASESGLRVHAIIPAAAALIAATVRAATSARADSRPSGTTLLLHLGEHGSVLAASVEGRLRFIRNFAVGVNSFVDALQRPIQPRHGNAAPVTLDRAAAREVLFAAGVPRREEVVDEKLGLDGAVLLPILQPVLQRCAVEVKQSLRFGLDEPDRSEVRLQLLGLGRCMPRLGESIAELHGAPLSYSAAAAPAPAPPPTSAASGATAAILSAARVNAKLLPRHIQTARSARALTRSLWAGAALAGLVVAADGVFTHLSLRTETLRAAEIATAVTPGDPALRLYDQTVAARSAVTSALARIDAALGGATDWSAVLGVLSEITPADIRLRTIDLTDEPGDGPRFRVRAVAAPSDATPPAVLIKQYLDAVVAVPLVADARLGATGRAVIDGSPVQEFELFCDLVPLPTDLPARLAAAPPTEPAP